MKGSNEIRVRPPLPTEIGMGKKRRGRRKSKKQKSNENFDNQPQLTSANLSHEKTDDLIRVKFPEEPKTAPNPTPRTRKIVQKTAFEENIESYIQRELENASSNSDRVYVYQRAFDFLISEFELRKKVLCEIKKYYDLTAKNLLLQKRKLETENISEFNAEENYNEVITKMRKAKKIEFKELKQKSTDLMNTLIELRLEKSTLSQEAEKLDYKTEDLIAIQKIQQEKTGQVSIKYQLLLDDITNITKDISDQGKEIAELNKKLDEVTSSGRDMNLKYTQVLAELDSKQKEKEDASDLAVIKEQEVIDAENELEEIMRNISKLERDKAQEMERFKRIEERKNQSDAKMRQILNDAGYRFETKTVPEIIQLLINSKLRK